MTDQASRVREIFDQAAEIASATERLTFLDSACAGDADLRSQVDALLKAYNDAGSFLDHPAIEAAAFGTTEHTEAFVGTPNDSPASSGGTHLSSAAQRDDDPLSFLSPSTIPGHLGRLGHYEIQAVIGKGGFGTVLKAFDEKLHRVVAIKVLSPAYAAVGSARTRFIREARTAAAVKNDHVVAIYSVQDEAQPPYLVMELIDGISLQDKLDKKGPLSIKEILRIGMQMAEGLAAAHKQGLVHRDIKPANILLENGVERVKITDFGLARAVDDASVTQSGTVAGTPMYMSPEQAEGLQIDHRSDLFSLGTVLYAMCTGHPPFRASGTHAVLKRVIDATPRPIREVNNEVPDWLADIIAKLHAKNPADRFQTAKEVAELLGQRLADVQAGRAIGEPSRVSGRVEAPRAYSAPRPITRRAPPAPRRSWRSWVGLIALTLIGVWFTFAGVMLITTPQRNLTPEGRLLAPILLVGGPSFLCWAVFFGARRTWVRWLTGSIAPLLGLAALVSPLVHDRLNPLPPPTGRLLVQTFATQVRVEVIPTDDPDRKFVFPPQDVASVLMERTVPAGNWRVIAYRGDNVYYQVEFALPANEQKSINIPAIPSIEPIVPEPGWVQLFNGKDLTGWKTHPDQPDGWQVDKNGHLVGKGSPVSHLFSSRGDYGDFHLRTEVKVERDGNSGVFFRSPFELYKSKPGADPKTYELQIADWGKRAPVGYFAGGIVPLVNTDTNRLVAGRWHIVELIARGNHFISKIDGVQVADCTNANHRNQSGHFALQAWMEYTVVHFKKIEIKELPPEAPTWVQLFNGKDLTGWYEKPGKQKGVWQVVDGILKGQATEKTHLFSDRENYRDFHLKVDARVQAAGEGGIVFRHALKMGYEAQIRPGSEVPTGSLWRFTPYVTLATTTTFPPPDEWFTLEVIARGSRLQVLVNGKTTADVLDTTSMQGRLALQAHGTGGSVEYRKIEIKELPPEEPGWMQLFNGKDLKGWGHYFSGEKVDSEVTAAKVTWDKAGQFLRCLGPFTSYLRTDKQYQNYELKLEYRYPMPAVDDPSSVLLHVQHSPGWPKSIEVTLPNAKPGAIGGVGGAGLAKKYVPLVGGKPRLGEWNQITVKSQGNSVVVSLNGMEVGRATGFFVQQGYIGLGLRSAKSEVHFRNVEIKELPPEEPGWVQLFNGKDVTGWKPYPRESWTVKEGILIGTAKGACRLTSERTDYQDYHLRFKAKTIYGMGLGFRYTDKGYYSIDYSRSGDSLGVSHGDTDPKVQTASWKRPALTADEWFDGELIVHGPRVTFLMNGFKIAELTGVPIRKGRIDLIVPPAEANVVQFQKIEIKELPASK